MLTLEIPSTSRLRLPVQSKFSMTPERRDMAKVNLDALIPREDFEVNREAEDAPTKSSIVATELRRGEFFFSALRKPDFQRDTDDWDPARVVDLIGTFLDGDLIPAVVLWRNKDLYFVIDGAHRLSAIIAWVQDDYGDGEVSQKAHNYDVPAEQIKIARQTRDAAHKAYGTFLQHQQAVTSPENFSDAIRTRAKRMGATLTLELQWVRGESSAKADQSFKRINQRSAIISPQEFHMLETRHKPMTIAARAIIHRGTVNKHFEPKIAEIARIAENVNGMLFAPAMQTPQKTADLPVCGSPYVSNILEIVHDLVELCIGNDEATTKRMQQDDVDGSTTIECLKATQKVVRLLCSNDESSLGLHPAIYFYNWTGKHQAILFLTITSIVRDIERDKKLDKFISCRSNLEEFLTANRVLIKQVVRKFGSKNPEFGRLRKFYSDVISILQDGTPVNGLVPKLQEQAVYSFLQPDEVAYQSTKGKKYSGQRKAGIMINTFLQAAPKCPECGCSLPIQALSVDHNQRREDFGDDSVDNSQVMHPYCNTGHKEKRHHKASQH